eukprot:scaffold44780_cov18-Tisochrysis_lutea.AAC.3
MRSGAKHACLKACKMDPWTYRYTGFVRSHTYPTHNESLKTSRTQHVKIWFETASALILGLSQPLLGKTHFVGSRSAPGIY